MDSKTLEVYERAKKYYGDEALWQMLREGSVSSFASHLDHLDESANKPSTFGKEEGDYASFEMNEHNERFDNILRNPQDIEAFPPAVQDANTILTEVLTDSGFIVEPITTDYGELTHVLLNPIRRDDVVSDMYRPIYASIFYSKRDGHIATQEEILKARVAEGINLRDSQNHEHGLEFVVGLDMSGEIRRSFHQLSKQRSTLNELKQCKSDRPFHYSDSHSQHFYQPQTPGEVSVCKLASRDSIYRFMDPSFPKPKSL